MTYRPIIKLADLTEKEWQQQVVDLALTLGWTKPYHTHDSRRSEPGWPDLALVRDRLVMLELKRQNGKLSDAQKGWIRRLHAANVETYVVRPADLAQLAVVLTARRSDGAFNAVAQLAHNALHTRTRAEAAG